MKSIAINWKTTLLGLSAILAGFGAVAHDLATGTTIVQEFAGPNLGIIFSGLIGIFAKDGNVTGGTIKQPSA